MTRTGARGILRREFGHPVSWAVWLLRAAFATLLLAVWIGPGRVRSPYWAAGNVASAVAVSLAAAFWASDRPVLLKRVEALLYVGLLLNMAGTGFRIYSRVPLYDDVLHFLAGAATVYVLHAVAEAQGLPWLWRWGTPLETGVFAFAMAVTAGALWEVWEGAMELLPGTNPIRGVYDTVKDLSTDTAGAAVGALGAARAAKRRGGGRKGDAPRDPRRPATR